jgi:hypothetical protein
MSPSQRIKSFELLKLRLQTLTAVEKEELFSQARAKNGWFTPESCEMALTGVIALLQPPALEIWATAYLTKEHPKKVGVIMAGNIPMVGFHDMLSVLISGHQLMAKLSSSDEVLLPFLARELTKIDPTWEKVISFVDRIVQPEAVIATGSDNSSRYFEYYFSKYPHIIRKNRTSVAIISGKEQDLSPLGRDIFAYFGLGCRNVSKLFVPQDYVFKSFFEALAPYEEIIHHHKYNNNYDYNKSIYLINRVEHYDNGFLMLTENEKLVSPISVVYYEYYQNAKDLHEKIARDSDKIQAIISDEGYYPGSVPFGLAQFPLVSDYADGVDTMAFLKSLHEKES